MSGMPAIGSSISAWGSGASAWRDRMNQKKQNNLDREFQYGMYMEDREYRKPENEMKRYIAAGLNPNLIYGNAGQSYASVPTSNSKPLPSHDAGAAIGRSFDQYQNVLTSTIQREQMAKQIEATDAEIKLKEANTLKANSETDWKNLSIENTKQMFPTQLGIAKEDLAGKTTDNITRYGVALSNWDKINAEVAKTKNESDRIAAEKQLTDIKVQLEKRGIPANSGLFERMMGKALELMTKGQSLDYILKHLF